MSYREVSEVRDGMRIDWDMPITMEDGLVLRCDVFRPVKKGRYPVILSHGPYGKWLHFEDGYKTAWDRMALKHPDVMGGSTNKYQSWEICDPEKWVPDGYVCVRVDSRGCGRSPGYVEHWSPRETKDFHDCIEWAGVQPWSNGKVGLSGISYYAINQWQVASLQPKHLAAICVWEGFADFYRELSPQWRHLQHLRAELVRHAGQDRAVRSRHQRPPQPHERRLGIAARKRSPPSRWAPTATISARPILRIRSTTISTRPCCRTGRKSKCRCSRPRIGAASRLHPRGNFEGFFRAASKQKWLEVHGIEHWTHYYTDYGIGLQKKFFGYFLKGETQWLGQAAARAAQCPPSGRKICPSARE